MREGFRILKPGGYLLGHDANPESEAVYHEGMGWNGVQAALKQFCKERGLVRYGSAQDGMSPHAWSLVAGTGHIFLIIKGGE